MVGFFRRTSLLPPTAYLVPSNAPLAHIRQAQILKARYGDLVQIGTGAGDDTTAAAALSALPGGIGKVSLLSGTLNLANRILINTSYGLVLEGQGDSSILNGGGVCTPLEIANLSMRAQVKNLRINSGNPYGLLVTSLTEGLLENVDIWGTSTELVRITASGLLIYRGGHFYSYTGYGIHQLAGFGNVFEELYFNENWAPGGTGVAIGIDGGSVHIKDVDVESFYRGVQLAGGYAHKIERVLFEGGHNVDISVTTQAYNPVSISDVASNGTGTAVSCIQFSINQYNIVVKGIRSIAHTGVTIDFEGYQQPRASFKEIYSEDAGGLGVILDDEVERIRARLGFLAQSPRPTSIAPTPVVIAPYEIGHGIREFDISGWGNNGTLYNNPTWGTLANGKGKLYLNGTTQYVMFPKATLAPNHLVNGDRTFIVVCRPDFLETENAFRCLFQAYDGADLNNYHSLIKVNNAGNNEIRFMQVGQGISRTAGTTIGFAQNQLLILIATYNNTTKVGTLFYNGEKVASFTGGESLDATPVYITNGAYHNGGGAFWLGDLVYFENLPICLSDADVVLASEILAALAGGHSYSGLQKADLFMDVLAVSANHVVVAQTLAADPTVCAIAAQPDCPRTLSYTITHPNLTAFTLTIIGVNGKGEVVTEVFTQASGWSGETSNAFSLVTSITMSAMTGNTIADLIDVGITDVLGLSNNIFSTRDVYKIKKNNTNAVVAAAQVNVTYDTYDMAVIGLAVGDDFTIWYKASK